jgi:hypothetical protein
MAPNPGTKPRLEFSGTDEIGTTEQTHEGIGQNSDGELILGQDYDWLCFSVTNDDSNDLNKFVIQAKVSASDTFRDFYGTWTANIVGELYTTFNLTVLAATSGAGVARVNVKGLYSIRYRMDSDTAASTILLKGVAIRDVP